MKNYIVKFGEPFGHLVISKGCTVELRDNYPVYENFDSPKIIDFCKLYRDENGIYSDIVLNNEFAELSFAGHVNGKVDNNVINFSICAVSMTPKNDKTPKN